MRRATSTQRVGFASNNGSGAGATSTQPSTQGGHGRWPSQGDGDLADWEADTHDEVDSDSSAPGDGSDTDNGPTSGEMSGGSGMPHSASMPRLIAGNGVARTGSGSLDDSVLSSTPPEPETEHYYKTQRTRRNSRLDRSLPTQARERNGSAEAAGAQAGALTQAMKPRGTSPSPPSSMHRAQSSPSRLGAVTTDWDGKTAPSPTEQTAALEERRQRSIHDTLLEYKGAFVGVPLGITALALVTVLGFDLMRSPR